MIGVGVGVGVGFGAGVRAGVRVGAENGFDGLHQVDQLAPAPPVSGQGTQHYIWVVFEDVRGGGGVDGTSRFEILMEGGQKTGVLSIVWNVKAPAKYTERRPTQNDRPSKHLSGL